VILSPILRRKWYFEVGVLPFALHAVFHSERVPIEIFFTTSLPLKLTGLVDTKILTRRPHLLKKRSDFSTRHTPPAFSSATTPHQCNDALPMDDSTGSNSPLSSK
jgi:hypothetical protein